jgi:hypothetical protein
MSQKTLKDVLKPPFKWGENHAIFDSQKKVTGNILFCSFLNGYGDRTDTQEEWRLQQEYMDFIVAAMNEKWERDNNEPLRWIVKESLEGYAWGYCPKCGFQSTGPTADECPRCKQQLLPPLADKEKK